MGISLTQDEFNEVRTLLDARITEAELPNETINYDGFLGGANDWADRQVNTDGFELTDMQNRMYRRCIRYRCASLLAGKVRQILRTGAVGITEQIQEIDWIATVQKLERDSNSELQALIESIGAAEEPGPERGVFSQGLVIFLVG